jgi:hypothetical protein
MPGAQYNTEIYVVMIVAGSIDEFNNIIVRNNYIQAMATLFNCVADDVTIVNVAAASVQVGTLIVSGDMSASNLAIQLLNSGNVSQIRAAPFTPARQPILLRCAAYLGMRVGMRVCSCAGLLLARSSQAASDRDARGDKQQRRGRR